jgi:hypothetical protein
MTFTDYLLDGALIAIVLLQIRGRRISARSLALPIGIVAFAAVDYLHGVPTTGNNFILVLAGAVTGLVLGIGCGLATKVFRGSGGAAIAKAGPVAAVLWLAGISARLAFAEYGSHGGQAAIARFSAAHHITSAQAWVACLVLMALAEVLSRTAVIAFRYRALGADPSAAARQRRPQRAIMDFRGRWS